MDVIKIKNDVEKETVTVAKLEDEKITVEKPLSAGVFLEFMELASENEMQATVFILKATLGEEQYAKVKSFPGLTFQHLSSLAENILEVVTEGVR